MRRPWVVVTRPEAEAQRWVEDLRSRGWHAVALPLLAFGPPIEEPDFRLRLESWLDFDAVMLVSPQAVAAWADVVLVSRIPVLNPIRFWAPGPGTARALRAVGVPADRIDQPDSNAAQFDSEHLWSVVAPQVRPGFRLLLVHGETDDSGPTESPALSGTVSTSARSRLAEWVGRSGGRVEACAAYRRGGACWTVSQQTLAHMCIRSKAVWVFSSSEAVRHLAATMPDADWSGCTAVATHPRIAQTLHAEGWGRVCTARPSVAEVHATLETCGRDGVEDPPPIESAGDGDDRPT